MERHLAEAHVLSDGQRRNARLKADDLWEGRLEWQSVPFRVLFEFNRRCNVKCVHCDIERAGTGELTLDVLARLLDEIGWGLWEVMPLVGGEPTLAPIHAAAPLLRRHNVHLNFITNGILFTREWFEPVADITARVQFSLHSQHREVFERIEPGADFGRVVGNLRDALRVAERTGAHVLPCVVALADVVLELDDYVDFVADLGCRRVIVQKVYPHTRDLEALDPASRHSPAELAEAWARVRARARARRVHVETNVDELYRDPEAAPPEPGPYDLFQDNVGIVELFRPGFCMSTATQAIVEWDGTVLPCIKDHIVLGNLRERSFGAIWNGEAMRALRRSFLERELRPHCARCKAFYNGHP